MSHEDLLESASQFQLVQVERSIAKWLRGYEDPEPQLRSAAENVGLRMILDLAALAGDLFEADGHEDAIANVVGRVLGNSYRQSAGYSTSYFASLAALTFAAAGNFASAKVLASSVLRSSDLESTERWMMEVLAHRAIELSRTSVPGHLRSYAQLTDYALISGHSEDFDRATAEFFKANKESGGVFTSSGRGLLLLWEQVHTRFEALSIARVMRDIEFPHRAYVERLLESSSLLYPSQAQALVNYPLTQRGKPVLVTLPTSTGKTLLGELSLVASLTWQPREHWLAVYLAPYRALTTQIMQDMRRRLRAAGIWCDMRRGGYLSDEPLRHGRPSVIVATPEAFDALLRRSPELYSGLAGCVFDEFHLIEQLQRGVRYEGLLGRLLRGAAGDEWPKIVALSPVVEDTEPIETWLETDAAVKNDWKPTTRRVAIVRQNRVVDYYTPSEPLLGASESQVLWRGSLPIPEVNAVGVALDQFRRFNEEPVLIVANTRHNTRELALQLRFALSDRKLSDEDLPYQLSEQIIRRYPYLHTLYECLRYGIAYHNAALPAWVRGEIEKLIAGKHLRFVVSTTTLAEGVDFSFRAVVLEDWSGFWQFGHQQPMSRLLVTNIAGRGGRAWAYIEGDTVLIERATDTTAFELYVEPASYRLESSISRVLETDSDERWNILSDSWAVVESQFIAFLSACSDRGNIEEEFAGSLYASQDPQVGEKITLITSSLVDDSISASRPVMQRESPLELTDFGEVILRTGLSPRSGMALADFVESYEPLQAPTQGSRRRSQYGIEWVPLIARIWRTLSSHTETWIRELQTYRFRQIGVRRFPVRTLDFNRTAMAWVSGVPIEAIGYLIMRESKRISRRTVREWLDGNRAFPPREFEGWIEKLSNDFCGDYLSRQWSWVFRGGAEICHYLRDEAPGLQSSELASEYENLRLEFEDLSLRLEFGVSDAEVARWLRRGCPVDRAKLDALKREYKSFPPLIVPDTFLEWLTQHRKQLVGMQVGPFPVVRVSRGDLERLSRFLSRQEP